MFDLRDMLALVSPAQRTERLNRYARVSAGGLLFAYRTVTASDGTNLRVQELMLPSPDRRIAPLEKSAALTLSYLDATGVQSGTRILISQGALNIADEPVLIDLRANAPMSACG